MGKNLKLLKAEMITNKEVYEEGDSISLKIFTGNGVKIKNAPTVEMFIGKRRYLLSAKQVNNKTELLFNYIIKPHDVGEISFTSELKNCRLERGNDLILNNFNELNIDAICKGTNVDDKLLKEGIYKVIDIEDKVETKTNYNWIIYPSITLSIFTLLIFI